MPSWRKSIKRVKRASGAQIRPWKGSPTSAKQRRADRRKWGPDPLAHTGSLFNPARNPGKKKMTKLQQRVKAHNTAKKRAKGKAAHALLKQMNPAGTMKRITGVRVRKLKGGGVTVTPVKAKVGKR